MIYPIPNKDQGSNANVSKENICIGIDLGTTYSFMCTVDPQNVKLSESSRIPVQFLSVSQESPLNSSAIKVHFDSLFSDRVDEEIQWLRDWITDEYEVQDRILEIEALIDDIQDVGLKYNYNLKEFDIDWYEIARHNEFKRLMEKDD